MKILIVTDAVGIDKYGVAQVVLQLSDLFKDNKIPYRILATEEGQIPECHIPFVYTSFKSSQGLLNSYLLRFFRWQPGIGRFIQKHINEFSPDVVHVHGCITSLSRTAVTIAAKNKLPVLLSAHGMIDPWLWRYRGFLFYILKSVYWKALQRPTLRLVNYVHAITQAESKALQGEFPNARQIFIPNAVDQGSMVDYPERPEKYFLFLGRLHPKKGVDLLLYAFKKANLTNDWRLLIVGPDFDPAYSSRLRSIVSQEKLADRVSFTGPLFGFEKNSVMEKAWAIIVPSYSEVIALVNLEAAAVQTPTITTLETGVEGWEDHGGVIVKPDIMDIAHALEQAGSWSLEERLAHGENIQAWLKEYYGWKIVGPKWLQAYEQILAK